MPFEGVSPIHLREDQVVAYLGHGLAGESLAQVELHLAQCAECRAEVKETREILKPRRGARWPVLAPIAAAAAALLFFTVWPQVRSPQTPPSQHRDPPTAGAVGPSVISPVGEATAVRTFMWSRTAGADQYRLTLYANDGEVLWRATTADSLVAPPDSVALRPGQQYLWKVEARVGWDAWESSELTPFRILADTVPPMREQGGR